MIGFNLDESGRIHELFLCQLVHLLNLIWDQSGANCNLRKKPVDLRQKLV